MAPSPNGPAKVVAFGAGLAALAVAPFVAGVVPLAAPSSTSAPITAVVLAVLFGLAEASVVHVQLRRQTMSISLSEIPLILGLFLLGPAALMLSRLAGSAAAMAGWRRLPPVKTAFNLALFAFETTTVVLVFHLVVGDRAVFGPAGWVAALLATLVGIAVSSIGVGIAVKLTEGHMPPNLVDGFTKLGIPTAFVNTVLGLIAATLVEDDARSGVLIVILTAALYFFYRSHTRLQNNHEILGELYTVTRTVDDALQRGGAIETLLDRTAALMRAELADLVIADDLGSIRYAWDADARQLTSERVEHLAQTRSRALGIDASRLFTGKDDQELIQAIGGTKDALLVELRGEGGRAGTLMVSGRLGDVSTFEEQDQQLFEALGNHAGIALRNSTLLERLQAQIVEREREALHDGLTGLPNRASFDRQADAAVQDPSGHTVVMLIDLDRFKEVNDTLGHQQGDRLLQVVSRRIQSAVGDHGLVARFGGDEFAVLLPHCADRDLPAQIAARIRRRVEEPVEISGLPLAVGASIGIARYPEDASDAESLLQRADVAMYVAKRGTGIEEYHPSANQYSPERLAMVAELRKAIERDELLVEFQPCVDPSTGVVRSVEALARWHHPDRGHVPPDTFIPIAERSGLIKGMTSLVLRATLRQCASWRSEGLDLRVAVNLSARSLMDETLPQEIQDQLDRVQLPATALVLEITESTIMDDPTRTIGMLNKLSSMGITLAVDDYGTGYSSLAYLKHLPVDELKLDRSFVTTMNDDPRDAILVRSTIALAHDLGMRVVAEGVEDEATYRALAELGCDLAQGYHISRPRTASQVFEFARRGFRAAEAPTPIAGRHIRAL